MYPELAELLLFVIRMLLPKSCEFTVDEGMCMYMYVHVHVCVYTVRIHIQFHTCCVMYTCTLYMYISVMCH